MHSLVVAIAELPSLLNPLAPQLLEPITQLIAQLPKLLEPGFQLLASVEIVVRSIADGIFSLLPKNPGVPGVGAVKPLAGGLAGALTTTGVVVPQVASSLAQELPRTTASPTAVAAEALTPKLLSSNFAIDVAPPAEAPTPSGSWLSNLPGKIMQAIVDAIRTASVAELAMAALPGLAGLLLFFATGVRVGHRQAKFGFAMEMTGIMRFAPAGPLGVVRSGSFIAVNSKSAPAPAARTQARQRRHLTLAA